MAQEYDRREHAGFADDSLDLRRCQEVLTELLINLTHTTIVIDALDECDPDSRQLLLLALRALCLYCPGKVHVFVSSRNDNDIAFELEGVPNHYIQPTDRAQDIEKFVHVRLDSAIETRRLLRGKIDPDLKMLIATELISKAQGMYVALTIIQVVVS